MIPMIPRPAISRERIPSWPAYTLIELLAVVVLLAIAFTAGLISLAGASDHARLREGASIVRDSDVQARLLASRGEPVVLSVEQEKQSRASAILLRTPDTTVRSQLPVGTSVILADSVGQPFTAMTFDASGRSGDYRASVSLGARSLTWRVHGLTGWQSELVPSSGTAEPRP